MKLMIENGIKVLLVGGFVLLRYGIAAALASQPWLEVCGETGDAPRARRLCEETRPDLIVLDLDLPTADGLTLAGDLARLHPGARILALSEREDLPAVQRAFQSGAHGYLSKQDELSDLTKGLQKLWAGESTFIGPRLGGLLLRQVAAAPSKTETVGTRSLSRREREVFGLIGKKQRTGQIAANLGVSVKTIETHYKRIKEKLGLRTAEDLRRRAAAEDPSLRGRARKPARSRG